MTALLIVAYFLTLPVANWLIGHVGTVCVPQGPCLIPVAPGIMAPSGVLMIGVALLLRDLVQKRAGTVIALGCVGAGVVISALFAPPALVIASAAAFAFSELTDFAVYTPLSRRSFALAIIASCTAGALADSALFLWLAFGSLAFIGGQIIGKLYAALIYLGVRSALSQRTRQQHASP